MRLFRGLTKDGDLVYGNYIYLRHDDGRESHFIQEVDAKYYSKPEYNRGWSHDRFEVIPETVGQSTGLKDNKRTEEYLEGQEIYEQDILRIFDKNYEVKIIQTGSGMCVNYGFPDKHNGPAPHWVEVIGNVHQNPELMEKE